MFARPRLFFDGGNGAGKWLLHGDLQFFDQDA
jgi:hypothetical protein